MQRQEKHKGHLFISTPLYRPRALKHYGFCTLILYFNGLTHLRLWDRVKLS